MNPTPSDTGPVQSADVDSVAAFASDLKSFKESAVGAEPLRALSAKTGISTSVLSEAFAGRKLPTENTVRRIVDALGGDRAEWVERRARLDPRRGSGREEAMEAPSAPDAPTRPALLKRPVSLGALLLAMALTAVIAVAGSLSIASLILPQASTAEAEPGPEATYLPIENGVDPMQTVCKEDAVLAGGDEFLDGAVLVEMMYSTHCMAVWGRVTRYDGLASGNSISLTIYPRDDPESDRNQTRTDSDLQSLYTTMLIEPDVEARVCGVATVTVDGEEFVQPNPVCI